MKETSDTKQLEQLLIDYTLAYVKPDDNRTSEGDRRLQHSIEEIRKTLDSINGKQLKE